MHGVRVTTDARRAASPRALRMGGCSRRAEDPNDVVILQDVGDVTKARTWLASDEMKAAREKGGVVASENSIHGSDGGNRIRT